MVDVIEPLSLVLWGVFFIAAGMYPLGFMLGSSCSLCCDGDCEPLFYRCLRQKSVNGSVPVVPSRTVYFLKEAGIIKASATASAAMSVNVQPHGYLSAGESVVYNVPVNGYGEAWGSGVECPGVSGSITVRVEGRDFPLKFKDLFLGDGSAGSATISLTGIASTVDDDRLESYSAPLTSSVVGVTVTSVPGVDPKQYLDAAEVTESVLRGMLSVSQPYFDAWSDTVRLPRVAVTFAGSGSLFRYIRAAFTVTWLVRVSRGTATTYFRVSARINRTASPPSVPEGMTQATIPSLPTVTDTPPPDDVAPVVTGASVLVKGHRIKGYVVSVPITLQLVGRCTVDVRSFYFGEVTATGTIVPPQLGQRLYANGSAPVSVPLDKYVFRMEQLVNDPAGEEYDFDVVSQYRRGEISLPIKNRVLRGGTFVTDRYEMQIVEPSPLCGMNVCLMPQDLLPQGITYTPAAGTKWDCKDAYPIVLGNPLGGCAYSHATNECRGTGGAGINLIEFYTPYKPYIGEPGYGFLLGSLDALTWLEFTPGVVTKPNGTYEITGTYNPMAGRYGMCYTAAVPNKTFSPGVGGVCQPAEYTVTISDIEPSGQSTVPEPGQQAIDAAVASAAGDYVLTPYGGGCWTNAYTVDARASSGVLLYLSDYRGIASGFTYEDGYVDPPSLQCNAPAKQRIRFDIQKTVDSFYVYGGRDAHTPATAVEQPYGRVEFDMNVIFGGGVIRRAAYTLKLDAEAGGPMTQCNNVSFSPTTITGEAGKNLFVNVVRSQPDPFSANIVASGEKDKCGYGVLTNYGNNYGTVSWFDVDRSRSDLPTTIRRTLVSDGSAPQVLTITMPGKCQSIGVRHTTPGGGSLIAPADGGCVVIAVVPNGDSCAWTATGGSDWAVIDDETQSGTGVGLVKVNVSPQTLGVRRSYVTVALSSDSTISTQVEIYQAR